MTFRLGEVAHLPPRLDVKRSHGCKGKLAHPTYDKARLQMQSMYEAGLAERGTLNVYRCLCGSWHVGHR